MGTSTVTPPARVYFNRVESGGSRTLDQFLAWPTSGDSFYDKAKRQLSGLSDV